MPDAARPDIAAGAAPARRAHRRSGRLCAPNVVCNSIPPTLWGQSPQRPPSQAALNRCDILPRSVLIFDQPDRTDLSCRDGRNPSEFQGFSAGATGMIEFALSIVGANCWGHMNYRQIFKQGTIALVNITTSMVIAWAQIQPATAATPPTTFVPSFGNPNQGFPASVQDGFTIAAGGDLLGLYKPRMALADPGLEQVVK